MRPASGTPAASASGSAHSALLRRRSLGRRGAVAALGHELVELGLILGHAQALEEFAEFALLVLEPAQRLAAVLVEGAVAARRRPAVAMAVTVSVHLGTQAVHLRLHAVLPLVVATSTPATHFPAPDRDTEDDETDRPPEDEAEDHQNDPAGVPVERRRPIAAMSPGALLWRIILRSVAHGGSPHVNVNYIYIDKPRPAGCQWDPSTNFGCGVPPPAARIRAPPAGPARADRRAHRPRAVPPATSGGCADPHRRGQRATRCRATATRRAAPSSGRAAAARLAGARSAFRRRHA